MKTARYVIWSNQHQAWWGPGHHGYTPWLEEAGRYDLREAQAIVDKATLGGQLVELHHSRLTAVAISTSPEHMMLAPESLADLLGQVEQALADDEETTANPERTAV